MCFIQKGIPSSSTNLNSESIIKIVQRICKDMSSNLVLNWNCSLNVKTIDQMFFNAIYRNYYLLEIYGYHVNDGLSIFILNE